MMRLSFFKHSILLLIILLFPNIIYAVEKDTIVWVHNDYAPIWILEGPNKGQGTGDLLQSLLRKRLKGYNHLARQANISRVNILMKNGEKVCTCAHFKTPDREKTMYFSKNPSMLSLSCGIITTKEKRHLLGKDEKIFLTRTLKNPNLKLGITQDRKYGPRIDEILKPYHGAAHIYQRVGSDNSKGLMMMLLGSRIDYMIGFDWELQFMRTQPKHSPIKDKLIFVPIQETQPYILAYIACSKTEWGLSILEKIDEILKEERLKSHYFKILEKWISNKEWYKKMYTDVFLIPPQTGKSNM